MPTGHTKVAEPHTMAAEPYTMAAIPHTMAAKRCNFSSSSLPEGHTMVTRRRTAFELNHEGLAIVRKYRL